MRCPQCKGYDLEPKQLENGLVAAGCSKCEGALLSLINYRFWSEHHQEVKEIKVSVDVTDELDEVNDKACVCPKCSRLMTKFKINLSTANQLDLCAHCDEAWLNKGEWRLLKQLELHGQLPKIFTDAWQRNLRIQRMKNVVKQRYVDMIGSERFERVEDFKQWLDQQPEKEEIKQYLITTYE
jgi:Zn-finger nucleic acid-binding protein